jgi:V8-like Glu-specific endopeptidase
MTTRKDDQRKDLEQTSGPPPLGPDEFVRLENKPATQRMPKELATEVETRRVSIVSADQTFEPKHARKTRDGATAWEIELPKGTRLGLPGQRAGRMSPEEVARGIKGDLKAKNLADPFKPEWVDFTPHPKIATDRRPLLRRIDGRPVEPMYGVFGSDDRQVYFPSGYPWACVGKILVWNDFSQPFPAWSGSGVLIGGRVVLTAGHVAPWGSGNWAMQFIPAFYDGGSTLGAGVSSWVSDYWGYNTGGSVSAWDMVVLRLYTPLGNTYGYFGTKDYSSSWQGGNYWSLSGYPGAVAGGNRPSRQMWWPVLDDDGAGAAEEIEFEADISPGNSGGPVFGFWDGSPYAIATVSGGSRTTFLGITLEDTNVGAGGGALNSLVAWARSNWP